MGSGASNLFTQNPKKRKFVEDEVPSFKIVLVGDPNVGKSSIFYRYTKEQYDYSYQPTMSVNIGNVTKKVHLPYETLVSVTLWDLPGREDIDLRRSYYKDVDAAIVIVDLCEKSSIDMAGTWKQDIYNNCTESEPSEGCKERKKSVKSQWQIPILLVGNKSDMLSIKEDEIAPEVQLLEEVASRHSFVGSVAVSARESDGGVHTAMRSLIRYLLQKRHPHKRNKLLRATPRHNLHEIFTDPTQHTKFAQALGSADDFVYESLKTCNLPQLDAHIQTAEQLVEQVERQCVTWLIAVKNMRRASCVAAVTDHHQAPVRECIGNLRQQVNQQQQVLKGVSEDDCIKLELTTEIPGPLKRIVDIFNNEVCKSVRTVRTKFGDHMTSLQLCLEKMEEEENLFSQKQAADLGLNKTDVKIVAARIHGNILRVKDAITLCEYALQEVQDVVEQVKLEISCD